jgi:hypothetical protein
MNPFDSKIVADGLNRIRDSDAFRMREEEIRRQLIQSSQESIDSTAIP